MLLIIPIHWTFLLYNVLSVVFVVYLRKLDMCEDSLEISDALSVHEATVIRYDSLGNRCRTRKDSFEHYLFNMTRAHQLQSMIYAGVGYFCAKVCIRMLWPICRQFPPSGRHWVYDWWCEALKM